MPQQKNNNLFYIILLVITLLFVFTYYQNNFSQQYASDEFTGAAVGVVSGNSKCEETDNGLDYYTKGEVKRFKLFRSGWRQVGSVYTDFCSTPGTLTEYYCNPNANAAYVSKLCNCQNGVCIQSPPPCQDECSPYGAVACANFNTTKTCGNFDTKDTCLEWGKYTACPFGMYCQEGQNGQDANCI